MEEGGFRYLLVVLVLIVLPHVLLVVTKRQRFQGIQENLLFFVVEMQVILVMHQLGVVLTVVGQLAVVSGLQMLVLALQGGFIAVLSIMNYQSGDANGRRTSSTNNDFPLSLSKRCG
ncbi:MAG: hypothetical protein DDT19_02079 [Syntrophomonadaceae bacterium]|nr:hypothetical protein [Bacillota bacterium]